MQIISGIQQKAQKIVIYGPEGIGKSTFASKFPSPLFIDTEGSTKWMDIDRVQQPRSWAELSNILNEFKQAPGKYQTLVIDTADWAEILCIEYVCDHYQKKGIEDFGYGKGYTYEQENFGKLLNFLSSIVEQGIHVVLTAHAKMRKFEQPEETGTYDRWELKLSKQVAPMVKEWADAVFFVNYKTFVVKDENNKAKATGGRRMMYTQHHPCWDAKNRYGLPQEVEFDYSVIAPFILDMTNKQTPAVKTSPKKQEVIEELDRLVEEPDAAVNEEKPPENAEKTEKEPAFSESGIPEALRRLMDANGVSEHDVQIAVANNGYYPADTPIANYDPDFINGKLIAGWDTFYNAVQYYKNLPYSGE